MDKGLGNKWSKGQFEPKKLVTPADQEAIRAYYKAETDKGRHTVEVLEELSRRYGRSERQIQRYLIDGQNREVAGQLNVEVRGRIDTKSRVAATPEDLDPLWAVKNPSYAGGIMWASGELLIINREKAPVNLQIGLEIPCRKDDPSRRFRVQSLPECLTEFAERIEPYFRLRPEHLTFPIFLESGHHVHGHAEFAIDGLLAGIMLDTSPETFKMLIIPAECLLEVEDLISGNKAEFRV